MNSYERVLMAYTKQKSDHVPIYCGSVSSRVASQILGHEAYIGGSIQSYRETLSLFNGEEAHKEFLARSRQDAYDWAAVNDLDFVRPTYWRYNYIPSKRLDEYTFRYDREDGTYWIMRFFPEPELFQCVTDTAPIIDDVDMLEAEVINQEEYTERYVPSPSSHSDYMDAMSYFAYEKASNTGGIAMAIPNNSTIWYECVAARPDLMDRYLEALMKRALKNIPMISAIGAKFVYGGGDCACNRGLMYSNEIFRTMVVPRFRKISDECHKYGMYHTFGSDGYFWDVADSLYIDAGIDAHYEADCTCGMSIRSIRSRYPNITVIGGIGASTLDMGTKEQVKEEVMEAINAAKEYGGAIVGCSNLVSPSTPMSNFMLMMELLHKYK